jgi:hypothetical protein
MYYAPLASPTEVVAATSLTDSTPRRPAIDVFRLSGGRYWSYR